jgi:hypothetical protein
MALAIKIVRINLINLEGRGNGRGQIYLNLAAATAPYLQRHATVEKNRRHEKIYWGVCWSWTGVLVY